MTSTTDVSKLYNIMEEDPGKYKDIINNEHKVRMAMRNWPLVRAMATQPADIPPVMAGEKFEKKTSVKQVHSKKINNTHQEQTLQIKSVVLEVEKALVSVPETAVSAGYENNSGVLAELNSSESNVNKGIDKLKSAIAAEVLSASSSVERVNVIEMTGRKVNDAVKIGINGKSSRDKTKLSSLFNRIEVAHNLDGRNSKLMKLRQV